MNSLNFLMKFKKTGPCMKDESVAVYHNPGGPGLHTHVARTRWPLKMNRGGIVTPAATTVTFCIELKRFTPIVFCLNSAMILCDLVPCEFTPGYNRCYRYVTIDAIGDGYPNMGDSFDGYNRLFRKRQSPIAIR